MSTKFDKTLTGYIKTKLSNKGRYNIIGVPIRLISEISKGLKTEQISYMGEKLDLPVLSITSDRSVPIVHKEQTKAKDENELAMNVRNNPAIFEDYLFASEQEVDLASGENTITTFPNEWNNSKNEFLKYISDQQGEHEKAALEIIIREQFLNNRADELWQKVKAFVNCDGNQECIEKTLGFAKSQLPKLIDNKYVIQDLFIYLHETSKKDSLRRCQEELKEAVELLSIDAANKQNLKDALEAFFSYLYSILSLNPLSVSELAHNPHYFYSPLSILLVDDEAQKKWSEYWAFLTFEKIEELLELVEAKRTVGKPGSGSDWQIELSNRIPSKLIHPTVNRTFNYTNGSADFKSSEYLHKVVVGNSPITISPALSYSHVEPYPISKSTNIKFINSIDQQSPQWKFIQLDKFEPGIAIGFSNVKQYNNKSYPKKLNKNIWKAEFKLNSRNSDKLEIIANAHTVIDSVHSVNFWDDDEKYGGLNTVDKLQSLICDNNSEIESVKLELSSNNQDSLERFSSYQYKNPLKYDDQECDYFVVIKTRNINTDATFCVIAELTFETDDKATKNNYFEKYLFECFEKGKEYTVDVSDNFSILQRIEDFCLGTKSSDPQILVLDEDMAIDWFERSKEQVGNIARNIFSDYNVKDNFEDFRPQLSPPKSLLNSKEEIIDRIASERFDLSQVDFTDSDLTHKIKKYCKEYSSWLESEPNSAVWYDTFVLCESDRNNRLINTTPSAIILPSYHPLKLLQQTESQTLMKNAKDSIWKGCPGAGLLDNTTSPSNIVIKYGKGFVNEFTFYAMSSDNQYVSLLINESLFNRTFHSKFYDILKNPILFNIGLFDSSNSISSSQVTKAIEDVSNIYSAKNKINISADDFGSDVRSGFTSGVFNWIKSNSNLEENDILRLISKNKAISVYDNRKNKREYPEGVELRSISNLSNGKLKWYSSKTNERNDLNVICNLPKDQFEIKNCDQDLELFYPLFGNYRYPNMENYHIEISPKMGSGIVTIKLGEDLLNDIVHKLETMKATTEKLQAQSNLNQLQNSLDKNKFTAVSGIDLDPSSFENITSDSLLYDYNTVGYSTEFGPINKYGYFLIANDKLFIKSSVQHALKRNFETTLNNTQLDQFIERISSNGISDLKSMYMGGNQTKGEIGAYVANHIVSKLKISSSNILNFVTPIDPFLPKINMLMDFLKEKGDVRERPDLIFFSICKSSLAIKMTPIEAKFRDSIDNKEMKRAMEQANSFSRFIQKLFALDDKLWKTTALDFLLMLINYGLNHQISQEKDVSLAKQLLSFRAALTNHLFHVVHSGKLLDCVDVTKDGRVIVVSPNASNTEFINSDNKFYRINIDEKYTFKCINNESIDELQDEWNRISSDSSSFFDLDIDCDSEVNVLSVSHENDLLNIDLTESNDISEDDQLDTFDENQEPMVESPTDTKDILPEIESTDISQIEYSVGKSLSRIENKEYFFCPNNTELNQLNIGIVGDLGTGKTQLLKNFIYHIGTSHKQNRGIAPKFLIFDTKKDYDLSNGGEIDTILHKEVNIRTLKPAMLPLNIFDLKNVTGTNKAYTRAKFISNIFKKIYNIGIVQENKLTTIILDCYSDKGYKPGMSDEEFSSLQYPNFSEIYERYDKEDSVKAILFDIVQSYIFETDESKHLSFQELFKNSLVVSLGDLVENQRELVMIIMLILYREYMIGIKKQPFIESNGISLRKVDSFILIDEANQIMDYEFDVLEDILLKGREFGVGVILSTQYMSHFKKSGINYAESLNTWFIHKQNRVSKRDILDVGLQNADEERIKQIKGLKVFECLYKSLGNDDGILLRGNPFFENFEK